MKAKDFVLEVEGLTVSFDGFKALKDPSNSVVKSLPK